MRKTPFHIMFFLLACVLVSGVAAQDPTQTPEATPEMTMDASQSMTNTDMMTASISTTDQISIDGLLVIDEVVSPGPGFIAIHADDNGKPGPIVGIAPVDAGTTSNVLVMFDAGGATPVLHAMLHLDDHMARVFEFQHVAGADLPVMDEAGKVVLSTFNLTAIRAYDQMISNDSVVVASVISTDGGWLVIHDDENGQPGAILGETLLAAGTNGNVRVTLNSPLSSDVFFPALYTDDNAAGTFEFDTVAGADVPFNLNGQFVALLVNATDEPTLMNAAGVPLMAGMDMMPMLVPGMMQTISDMTPEATMDAMDLEMTPEATMDALDMEMTAEATMAMTPEMTLSSMNEFAFDSVISAGAGFVDVHADAKGHPGASLGHTAVNDGENSNVVVMLDSSKLTDMVWPMLHTDDNEMGVYEFMQVVGADLPVVVNGAVVTMPVTLDNMDGAGVEMTPEATMEMTAEATMEMTAEATMEMTAEATMEMTAEATMEMTAEATMEMTAEATMEMTAESTQQP